MTTTQRLLTSIEGMYYRLDNGKNTGRNASSTDATLALRWKELDAALEAGGFEELDNSPTLAAKYNRLTRRRAGLVRA